MFTKIWWVHTLFTKKDEKKEKKKVGGEGMRLSPVSGKRSSDGGGGGGGAGRDACVAPTDKEKFRFKTLQASQKHKLLRGRLGIIRRGG